MNLTILRLEGPLQSWGEDAKWDDRPTSLFPTKSGIVGLIACCMGLPRGSEKIVQISGAISVGIRADRPGRVFVDFHTVSSDKMMNADGKCSSRTIITPRQYLNDASFTVVFSCNNSELQNEIIYALNNPVWVPYLGRKSCVPTTPIFCCNTEQYSDIEDALRHFNPVNTGTVLCEIDSVDGLHSRADNIVDSKSRKFSDRRVKYISIEKEEADVSFADNS